MIGDAQLRERRPDSAWAQRYGGLEVVVSTRRNGAAGGLGLGFVLFTTSRRAFQRRGVRIAPCSHGPVVPRVDFCDLAASVGLARIEQALNDEQPELATGLRVAGERPEALECSARDAADGMAVLFAPPQRPPPSRAMMREFR
jgi:hypothetical protein